jgi:hypothetical protein
VTLRGDAEAYTVAPGAPRAAVDAAHRGALLALVQRLELVSLEIPGRGPWPPEVAEAVTALLPRRRRLSPRRRASVCTDLVPTDSRELALAMAVAPYADYVVGITHDGPVAYDTVDQGTAPRFELTAAELQATRDYMAAQGISPDLLVPDTRRDTHG